MIDPNVETRPWPQQLELDDGAYRRQIVHLLEHSPFYREKLEAAGFGTPARIGGLAEVAGLPFTEKSVLRTTCSDDNPIPAHLAVPRERIVRIYSTSGTTGSPAIVAMMLAERS